MSRFFPAPPSPAPQRISTLITVAAAVCSGIYSATVVLYFTRIVRISPMRIGVGLGVAVAASVIAGVLIGKLSDRRGPLRGSVLVVTVGFLVVDGFPMYLVVSAVAAAQLSTTAIIPQVVSSRVGEFRAYIRSVLNVDIAVGIGIAAAPGPNRPVISMCSPRRSEAGKRIPLRRIPPRSGIRFGYLHERKPRSTWNQRSMFA
ncbi:hypothetical protein OHB12_21070 [Nocardia sp. NBC_01730]|uniref:hypothetical protein n=1 Tax=Nocardia sp. NBC_01730 TaxID=2975998 RepID=UPI002E15B32A|nr:hypothetical protein OHB12_21070 [Nocardia sp. NBC_01730]